ncbi:MAG: DUF4864 domain-containing protein [Paracoccaceae bacterium]
MRLRVYAMLLAVTMGSASFAQEARNSGIEAVINGQIAAFQADDFASAFAFASPNIQGIFGTADNFGAMVKNGYPMVWRPSAVKMLGLREAQGGLWQRVLVTDQAGHSHMLDYQMIETPGGWQINAVQLLPQADVGA